MVNPESIFYAGIDIITAKRTPAIPLPLLHELNTLLVELQYTETLSWLRPYNYKVADIKYSLLTYNYGP